MNIYTNKFSFAANNYKDEIVLSFSQECPVFTPDHGITDSNIEPVANLVMSSRLAHELAEKLLDVLDSDTVE